MSPPPLRSPGRTPRCEPDVHVENDRALGAPNGHAALPGAAALHAVRHEPVSRNPRSGGLTLIPQELSSASTPNATNAPLGMQTECQPPPSPRRSIRFSIEIGCLLCARDVGVLECTAWPSCAGMLLRRAMPAVMVSDWHHLHCDTCGGSVIPVEVTRRWIRNEPAIDWLADRPR